MIDVASVELAAGRHTIALLRPGAGLGPGAAAPTFIDGIYLETDGTAQETVRSIPPAQWKSLCGRPLDWVEVT